MQRGLLDEAEEAAELLEIDDAASWPRRSSKRFSSSQALLMPSHISMVSAVRTARALVRARSMQLRIEEGFARIEDEELDDAGLVGLRLLVAAWKDPPRPPISSALSHSLPAPP